MLTVALSILIFAIILTVVVFIHELGHFIAARWSGVYVEEFGIGLPPRLFGFQFKNGRFYKVIGTKAPVHTNDTVYSLNALPLGGYVKLYGDGAAGEGGDVSPSMSRRTLDAAPPYKRLIIMLAGVFMNVLLAVFIYSILLGTNGHASREIPILGDYKFKYGRQVDSSVEVVSVNKSSAAYDAGLKVGDVLRSIKVDGQAADRPIASASEFRDIVAGSSGKSLTLSVTRSDDTSKTYYLTPRYDSSLKRHIIGVAMEQNSRLVYDASGSQKILSGALHSYNMMDYSFYALGTIFQAAKKSNDYSIASEAVSGPVGMGRVVFQIFKYSGADVLYKLVEAAALVSLSLAFMNILPIPALDGGRVALLLPELLTGRRVNRKVESAINNIGFIALMALSLLITLKDVIQLFR